MTATDRPGRAVDRAVDSAELEASLIGGLTGTVLEIGAGDGANFGMLAESVDWTGPEPAPRPAEALRTNAAR